MGRFLTFDRALGIALVALAAVLWFLVLPVYVKGADQSFFPRVAIGWIAVCATAIALLPSRPVGVEVAGLDDEDLPAVRSEPAVVVASPTAAAPSVYLVALIWGAYAVSLGVLGFYVSTWLMLVISMAYLGIRRLRPLVIRPVLTLLVVHLVIERLLRFRLPEAFWS